MSMHRLSSKLFLAAALALPAMTSAQDAAPATPAPADGIPAAPGPAAPDPAAVPTDALPGHFAEERRSAAYTVVAIDPTTRIIMLREDGEDQTQAFAVGKDVRNLENMRVGDRVTVDSYTSSSIKVLPPGELVNEDQAQVARAQPGERPGGTATRTRTMTAEISSIFPEAKEFMTRNEKGQLRTWKVRDAKQLEGLSSGDRVQLTLSSRLAVNVTPAPTTTPAPGAGSEVTPGTAAPAAETTPAGSGSGAGSTSSGASPSAPADDASVK